MKLINKNHFKFAFVIRLKSFTTLKITLIIKHNIITQKNTVIKNNIRKKINQKVTTMKLIN